MHFPTTPIYKRGLVWAIPGSLATTTGITICFLFLRVLRCFSSPGSLLKSVNFLDITTLLVIGFPIRKSLGAYFQIPKAYRRISRPSSPISPKASTIHS